VDGQPSGLLSQTTQSVSGTTLSWANTCELIRVVEAAGGADNVQALIGPTAAKTLRTREKSTGSGYILAAGRLDTVPAIVTNTMPADALLVGNFAYAIHASWGPALEIVATPKASRTHFMTGLVSIRCIASLDIGAAHPNAFAKATSIT
jgi:HK97 family phage major capsid protein